MNAVLRIVSLALMVVLFIAGFAVADFNRAVAQHAEASSALQFASPTPVLTDTSEIGSTDGILFMGMVIALIVILPLLFRKTKR